MKKKCYLLTAAQVKRLHTEELKLVHNSNPDTVIMPQVLVLIYNHNTVSYASSSSRLEVHYDGSNQSLGSSHILNLDYNGDAPAPSQIQQLTFGSQINMSESKGKHLYLKSTLENLADGDGTLEVIIYYIKLNLL